MGTNYYRIPSQSEMEERKQKLEKRISEMKMTVDDVERGFHSLPTEDEWSYDSLWTEFVEGTRVHLGKRSSGWKFLWNFNNNKYYKDKESLMDFINSGRVVNEYSEELSHEEFINMALEWGQPDGWDLEDYYKENPSHRSPYSKPEIYIDGLRVSDCTDFS